MAQEVTLVEGLKLASEGGIPNDVHVGKKVDLDTVSGRGWANRLFGYSGDDAIHMFNMRNYTRTKSGDRKIENALFADSPEVAIGWTEDTETVAKRWNRMNNVFEREGVPVLPLVQGSKAKGWSDGHGIIAPTKNLTSEGRDESDEVSIFTFEDMVEGIHLLKSFLSKPEYTRITYTRSDGTNRVIITTYNHELLDEYYKDYLDALGDGQDDIPDNGVSSAQELTEEEKQNAILEKVLRQASKGQIRVPDLEAPVSEGVFRIVTVAGIKSLERVGYEEIDQTMKGINYEYLTNEISVNYGNIPASNLLSSAEAGEHELPEVKVGITLVDYLEEAQKSGRTKGRAWLLKRMEGKLEGFSIASSQVGRAEYWRYVDAEPDDPWNFEGYVTEVQE